MIPRSKTKTDAISGIDILHLCKVYLPVKGGVQRIVHSITNLIEGYHHSVLTTGEDGAVAYQEIDGASVSRCRSYLQIASLPIAPSFIFKARQKIKNASLICLHYPFPLADLALALFIKLPPVVVFWHSEIVAQKKLKWLIYPLIYLTLRRAKAIVVTSDRMIEFSGLLKTFNAKIKVVPYGISSITEHKRKDKNCKPYFLIVGRHVSYKGIEVALNAIRNLDARLIIAGDGPLFEQHRLLAQSLDVDHKVTFKKNACDQEIKRLIEHCLALLVPSVMRNEAFALVQLEAMRSAKPVINTQLDSTVPLVARHEREALTVPPGDSAKLSAAIARLLSDAKLSRQLGENGLRRFQNHFSEQHYRRALQTLFDEILTQSA